MKRYNPAFKNDESYYWYGVDLDETLAEFTVYSGLLEIGKPIPKMVERVKRWLSEGSNVRILTARVAEKTLEKQGYEREEVVNAIQKWCKENIGVELPVTEIKDGGLIELWDDRAIQVIPNTGERMCK